MTHRHTRAANPAIGQHGRVTYVVPAPEAVTGPSTGDDRAILTGYLRWQRYTLLNICAGLDGDQLATRAVPPSDLSLLGLIRHLAKVERVWLRQRAAGEDIEALHGGPGDPSDFADIDPGGAEAAVAALTEEWTAGEVAIADLPWDLEVEAKGRIMSLRMVHVHLIGEYARHNGHADLLRQALDGVTRR